jgi:hypothetical protein
MENERGELVDRKCYPASAQLEVAQFDISHPTKAADMLL